MEQNKLETQFKEKLNSREIKPTEMAWDKLDSMLSAADEPKRKFTWLYIAASFIGFFMISTVFFNQKGDEIDIKKNTVVIESTSLKENSKTEINTVKKEPNFSKTIKNPVTKPLVQTQKNINYKVKNSTVNSIEIVEAEIQPNNQNLQIEENKNVSHENIESLLASVEKNSKSDRNNSSIKINSTDLLNQVDGELEVSFRERALNTITKKYKEAKEAFANRNNQ